MPKAITNWEGEPETIGIPSPRTRAWRWRQVVRTYPATKERPAYVYISQEESEYDPATDAWSEWKEGIDDNAFFSIVPDGMMLVWKEESE